MSNAEVPASSRHKVLVVDGDAALIGDYVRWLGEAAVERSSARFEVHSRNQGDIAVEAVAAAMADGTPFSVVFIGDQLPPGMNGIDAGRQIRALDSNVNIVVVSGSAVPESQDLGVLIPPADKVFFLKKPLHAIECRQLAAALSEQWHVERVRRSAFETLERRFAERTEALTKLAYFDPVTRLPNQLQLLDELQAEIDRGEDNDGDTAVVLLDVERFSFINETLGYDAGTDLLRSLGNRLSRTYGEEGPGQSAIVGRFGADGFAVIVAGVENEAATRALAEQVKATVEKPFLIDGRDLYVKCAVGVAWHPVHGRDARTVFRSAEAALRRSIRSIGGPITYYHSEMRYRARYRFDLEAELRAAIDAGQIGAHYQPQQCTRSGELAGVEALARWTRPDGSMVPPGDFIPLGEEMGISDELFETVLRKVCGDISDWRESLNWNIPVSVNLSAHQLRNRDLVSMIKGILVSENVNRNLINLELTETVLLEDLTIAEPVLNDLAAFGVGIHIDDFGTGYSSLSYLAQLPVQTLKIDQAFVAKLDEDNETTRRVIEAIIALGKAMRLSVVAEGVETDRQYATVRRLGCDLVQGFFVARPMPAEQLQRWVHGYVDTQSIKKRSMIVDIDSRRSR